MIVQVETGLGRKPLSRPPLVIIRGVIISQFLAKCPRESIAYFEHYTKVDYPSVEFVIGLVSFLAPKRLSLLA